jgi:uncharacterized protein (TIGR03067 family)
MPDDLDLLQGSWSIAALEVDGQPMPAAMLGEARIAITGSRFRSTGMGAIYEGTLELGASATPRRIDMKFDAGPEKGNTNSGIYERKGDGWRICIATRGGVRPSGFATAPGSGFALETLVRGNVPAAAQEGASEEAAAPSPSGAAANEFDGEWRLVSGIMEGRPMDESVVKWVRRVSSGNRTEVYAGPQTIMKLDFTSDASQSPKTIDYFNKAGANKGKTQRGIYEFDGTLLTICVSAPGDPRPAEFQPGKRGTLTVWKRR